MTLSLTWITPTFSCIMWKWFFVSEASLRLLTWLTDESVVLPIARAVTKELCRQLHGWTIGRLLGIMTIPYFYVSHHIIPYSIIIITAYRRWYGTSAGGWDTSDGRARATRARRNGRRTSGTGVRVWTAAPGITPSAVRKRPIARPPTGSTKAYLGKVTRTSAIPTTSASSASSNFWWTVVVPMT